MSTAAQITANQANAQLSTGPRSLEGRARVSQNAISHGLTAKHLVIREDEREEFAVFQNSLAEDLRPQGALETVTYHELLHAAWTLARLRRIEAEICCGSPMDLHDPDTARVLDRLGRYQARAQRAYYRAMQELRVLQTNRAFRDTKLDKTTAAAVPAAADIKELTKQTQSGVTAKALQLAVKMVEYETGSIHLESLRNLAPSVSPRSDLPAPEALSA